LNSGNLNPPVTVDKFLDSFEKLDSNFDSTVFVFLVSLSISSSFKILVLVSLILVIGLLVPKLNNGSLLVLLLIGFVKLVNSVSILTVLFLTSSGSFRHMSVFSNDEI